MARSWSLQLASAVHFTTVCGKKISSIVLERIKTCLRGRRCRTNDNRGINRTVQSAAASDQVTTFQWFNPYKCFLFLVQILGYSVVTNCHRVGWWLNISFCLHVFHSKLYFHIILVLSFHSHITHYHKAAWYYLFKQATAEKIMLFFFISWIITYTQDQINFYLQPGLSTATVTNQISTTGRIHWDLLWAPLHLGLMSVFHSLLIAISYLGDLNNSHW